MKMLEFSVKGYKNFTQEVTLSELGPINIIHGENNVGKSNLLESIHLFFRLLSAFERAQPGTSPTTIREGHSLFPKTKTRVSEESLKKDGHSEPIFDVNSSLYGREIHLRAKFGFSELELLWAGMKKEHIDLLLPIVTVAFKLEQRGYSLSIEHFEISEYQDEESLPWDTIAFELVRYMVNGLNLGISPVLSFVMIEEDRRIKADGETDILKLGAVPQELKLEFYDAKESLEPSRYQRWELFVDSLKSFSSQLGEGKFVALYDRKAETAELVWETESSRIPVGLLGSGIQQIAGLVGRLVMTNAAFVAIEEPELNLRYTTQLQLRDVLRTVVEDERGPSQIFLTSHSPAFETGDHFYGMYLDKDEGYPVLKRQSTSEALNYTGHEIERVPDGSHAPLCYVTTEGLVLVPEGVREKLGVLSGGGVTFVTNPETDRVEMMSDDQFYELMGENDDDE